MTWRRSVAIGDFVADSDGSDFRVSYLEGWEGGPPVRSSITDKSQQDGGDDGLPLYGPRVVTVTGRIEQASRAAAMAVLDHLSGLSLGSLHEFVVDDPNVGVRSSLMRVEAGAVPEWVSPVSFAYSITLKAPDPFKYGPQTFAQTTLAATGGGTPLTFPLTFPLDFGVPPGVDPGAINLLNGGTVSYHPRVRVDGRVVNPKITCTETGSWIRYGGTVATGQWLDIDTARRRVMLNGLVPHRHLVTYSGDWLSVPVGGGSLTWTADSYDSSHALSAYGFEGAWA